MHKNLWKKVYSFCIFLKCEEIVLVLIVSNFIPFQNLFTASFSMNEIKIKGDVECAYFSTTRIYYFSLIIYLLHEHAFNQQKMNFLLYIEGKCTFLVWGNYTYRKKNHEKGLCQHANHFFIIFNIWNSKIWKRF